MTLVSTRSGATSSSVLSTLANNDLEALEQLVISVVMPDDKSMTPQRQQHPSVPLAQLSPLLERFEHTQDVLLLNESSRRMLHQYCDTNGDQDITTEDVAALIVSLHGVATNSETNSQLQTYLPLSPEASPLGMQGVSSRKVASEAWRTRRSSITAQSTDNDDGEASASMLFARDGNVMMTTRKPFDAPDLDDSSTSPVKRQLFPGDTDPSSPIRRLQDSERALKERLGQREETVAVLETRLQHAEEQLALRNRDTQSWNERENNLLSTIEDLELGKARMEQDAVKYKEAALKIKRQFDMVRAGSEEQARALHQHEEQAAVSAMELRELSEQLTTAKRKVSEVESSLMGARQELVRHQNALESLHAEKKRLEEETARLQAELEMAKSQQHRSDSEDDHRPPQKTLHGELAKLQGKSIKHSPLDAELQSASERILSAWSHHQSNKGTVESFRGALNFALEMLQKRVSNSLSAAELDQSVDMSMMLSKVDGVETIQRLTQQLKALPEAIAPDVERKEYSEMAAMLTQIKKDMLAQTNDTLKVVQKAQADKEKYKQLSKKMAEENRMLRLRHGLKPVQFSQSVQTDAMSDTPAQTLIVEAESIMCKDETILTQANETTNRSIGVIPRTPSTQAFTSIVEKKNHELSVYKARVADLTMQMESIQEERGENDTEPADLLRRFARTEDLRRRRGRKSPLKPLVSPKKFKQPPAPAKWSRVGFALSMMTLGMILGTLYVGWSLRTSVGANMWYGGDEWRYQPEDLWYNENLYGDDDAAGVVFGDAENAVRTSQPQTPSAAHQLKQFLLKLWTAGNDLPDESPVVENDLGGDHAKDGEPVAPVFTGNVLQRQ